MAVAGVVVLPQRGSEEAVLKRLRALEGVSIEGQGKGGIALVLEAPTVEALRKLSEEIQQWEEVIDLQLNYLNWEEL
jgi:nitrate reductase NapAB chaperone NapD